MIRTRYPFIQDISLAVLIRSEPSEVLTPELVSRALSATSNFAPGPESFETVRADLDKAHLLDEEGRLSVLANRYADMWRRFLAKSAAP
jgi:hypothetical protein